MYICFYFEYEELQYESFSDLRGYYNFIESYKNSSSFSILCLIHDSAVLFFDPVEFDILLKKAGDSKHAPLF